jgi:hypothetical protein
MTERRVKFMQELKVLTDEKGNKYIEIAGKRLNYEKKEKKAHGEYDSFDMNPAARNGSTCVNVSITLGDLRFATQYDNDNPINCFSFYSEDLGDGKVEISVSYYLSRGGNIAHKMGIVDVSAI